MDGLQAHEIRGDIPPMKRVDKQVGARIRQAREQLDGVTIERLERAARLPPGILAAIEAGTVAATDEQIDRLADKLKRNPVELWEGPLLPQAPAMRASVQRLIGNSQGGRQAESWADPEERARLGKNLRFYREAAGLSQSQTANALGIATPNISVFESPAGKYGPSAETLGKMAELFGCTVEQLKTVEHPVVIRTKVAGDVSALPPERRAALDAEVAAFERRMTRKFLEELEAETAKHKRRK